MMTVKTRYQQIVLLFGLAGMLAGGACSDAESVTLPPYRSTDGGPAVFTETYVQGRRELDILFVLDNSAGMAPVLEKLSQEIGLFIAALQQAQLDWRIGVITSDIGIAPFSGPGCSLDGEGAQLLKAPRSSACTILDPPYLSPTTVDDPQAAFACIAALSDSGCGFERPLEAALQALDPQTLPAVNNGFIRPAAQLLIVWLSNEDDCSAQDTTLFDPDNVQLGPWISERCFYQDVYCDQMNPDGSFSQCSSGHGTYLRPVEALAADLKALKPGGAVSFITVVGLAEPVKSKAGSTQGELGASCSTTVVEAKPAIRFHEFLTLVGEQGRFISICEPALGSTLAAAATQLLAASPPYYCLRHALKDPLRPGCRVEIVQASGALNILAPAVDDGPGFYIGHPLQAGCENGALLFSQQALPPDGAEVRIACVR